MSFHLIGLRLNRQLLQRRRKAREGNVPSVTKFSRKMKCQNG